MENWQITVSGYGVMEIFPSICLKTSSTLGIIFGETLTEKFENVFRNSPIDEFVAKRGNTIL